MRNENFWIALGRTVLVLPFFCLPAAAEAGGLKNTELPAPLPFEELAHRCAPQIHPDTLRALVRVESGFNPYAIGVVGGSLSRQPRNLIEAVHAARSLRDGGKNFSMGLAQINVKNLPRLGLDLETVFDPCLNLQAAQRVLGKCFAGAASGSRNEQHRLQKAFSCYYSGNYRFGFTQDFAGQPSYVQKVVNAARADDKQKILVPAVDVQAEIAAPPPKAAAVKKLPPKAAAVKKLPRKAGNSSENPAKSSRPWDVFGDF